MKISTNASKFLAQSVVFIVSAFFVTSVLADANPTVTINQAGTQDPTNSTSIVFTAVFSDPVIDFTDSDVTISGTAGATTAVVSSGDNITWTITISGMTGPGTVVASIGSGVCTNAALEPNNGSTSVDNTVTYDNSAPGVTVNKKSGQADPTNASPILFTVVFGEPINATTFTAADINLTASTTGGTLTPTITEVAPMDKTTYEVSVALTGGPASGNVIASIDASAVQDLAGNGNTVSTQTDNVVAYDITGPSVTVNKKSGQADPTNVSPILFTVVFSEPINGGSFTAADINLTASTTGGTLTPTITEVTPMDQTTYEVSVALTGSPVSGDVIASINASTVQDPLGNNNSASTHTDNIVLYQLNPPTVTSPTVAGIGETDADLGGNITSNGGSAITERGTVWKISPGVTITDNKLAEGGTALGVFTHNRSSLPSGTQIYFRAYATNAIGDGLSPESSFFTFSAVPTSSPASVVATAVGTTQINLTFSAASTTGVNTDGYIILRRIGSDPATSSVQDGVAPGALATGSSVLVAVITSLSQTTYSDTGLSPATAYHYAVVPYNFNGVNDETYNYRVGAGFTTDNATTFNASSDIVLNGGTTLSIDYKSYQNASGLTSTTNSENLATFEIRDGGSANDADNTSTTLTNLTIQIGNFQNIRRIALFDGTSTSSTEIAGTEQDVTSSTVSWSGLSIVASDNGVKSFTVRVTFKALVTDNQYTQVTITSASTASTGSGFAAADAGGATTGGAANQIAVTATKLKFNSIPTGVLVSSPFNLTVTAVDDPLENVDLDETGQIDPLEINPNPSSASLTIDSPGSLTANLVAGTHTFTNLRITPAGTYNLRTIHSLIDAQGLITIVSNGVTVTPANPITMCYNSAFLSLSTITITEGDPSDFAMGDDQIFSLVLPAGFVFNTAVTPTLSLTGTELVASGVAPSYVGNSIVRVAYSVTGTSNLNTIGINGLQVKYTGSPSPTSGNILRYGGTAVQAGNMDADGKNHGTLTADASPTVVDFTVDELPGDPVQDPAETRFSINTSAVKLIGSPIGGVFTGNGVIFTGGEYTFNPSAVGVGNNYQVLYTYNEPSGQQCQVTKTKTFEVYASVITNLNLEYCTNSPASNTLSVTQAQIDALYPPSGTKEFHDFVYYLPGFGYTPITPTNNIFDPSSSNYTSSISIYKGVYIYYRVRDVLVPTNIYFAQYQFVTMNPAPNVTFTPLKTSFCEDEPPIALVGSPPNSNTTANDFFTASGGQQTAISSGGNPVVWAFSPTAVSGVTPTNSVSFNVTYTYKDNNTLCSNTSPPVTITVHPRPDIVPTADITSGTNLNTCQDGGSVTFTTNNTTWATTTYNWYADAPLSNLLSTANSFSPSVPGQLNTSAPGTTNFYVTRTINGCESNLAPLTLNAVVDPPAIANAGSDYTICAGNEVVFSSFATIPSIGGAATGGSWSAIPAGGTFKDASNNITDVFGAATKFIPSPNHISSGSVRLVLTTNDPGGPCPAISDDVTITINPSVVVNAGNDYVVCSGQGVVLNGNITGGTTNGTWTRNGQGGFGAGNTATITDPLTFYNPSATELTTGANITFTLTSDDPDGGGPCPALSDNVVVTINQRAIVNAGSDQVLCDGEVIQLAAVALPNPNSSATSYTWSGGAGTFSPDANAGNAVYTPDISEVGTEVNLTLTSNDPDGTGPAGPCPAEEDKVSIIINKIPEAPFAESPNLYCRGENIDNLTAVGTTLRWYDDESLSVFRAPGPSFATGETSNVDKVVDFFVTQTIDGCESPPTTASIIVNPLPVAMFTEANFCLGDFTTFTDSSTLTYNNGLSGSITEWQWNFDDGQILTFGSGAIPANTHGGQTTGDYNNPSHNFKFIGLYNVRLTVRTSDGCENFTTSTALFGEPRRIGPVPVANFSISNEVCDQDITQFNYTGTIAGQIDIWAWNFGDPASASNTATTQNTAHTFTGVSTTPYPVSLTVTTDLGCQDEVTKPISILPYIKNFPYQESFEASTHGWVMEGLNSNGLSSWQWNTPNGAVINSAADGIRAWFTRDNTLATYNNNERSVLYSPCFDMTQLQRPVLSMEYWNHTDPGVDGAYLEYLDMTDQTWKRLGLLNEGLEWYNRGAIIGLSQQNGIGQSIAQLGWSGITPGWITGKYNMDTFGPQNKLRLRVVFGSNADAGDFDGFALDNFIMETRNRVILAENFTSLEANNAAMNNQNFISFKQANPAELVKLQYHIALPGADDIHKDNRADPNARAAFYGLTNSNSIVPRIFLDGLSDNPGNFVSDMSWANISYNKRSLVNSPLELTLNTLSTDNNKLAVQATVKALRAIPSGKPALFIAVVEKTVNNQEFVVRKLLPSATGSPLTLPMTINQQVTVTPDPWEVRSVNDLNQIAVLAFVQDIETRDVLQAIYLSNPGNLPSIITGIENSFDHNFKVYPNPADKEMIIALPEAVTKRSAMKVFDHMGKVVNEGYFEKGDTQKTITTTNLAGGVYLIQIASPKGTLRKKVMVLHRN